MKKIFCVVIALVMVGAVLSGCTKKGDGDYKSEIDFGKYDPPIELTTDRDINNYIPVDGQQPKWEDDPYIKWCEVNLGIIWKPKFVVGNKAEHDQKLSLLAATNDLPDVICDAPEYLIKEWYDGGFLRVLEDDINKWGSDLTKYIIMDEYKKQTNGTGFAGYTTPENKFYALPMVLDPSAGAWTKFFYRADVLNELGMKEPTSIVELEEVLAAYKAINPDKAAIVLDDFLFGLANPLFQIFGSYIDTFYEKDGKIVCGSIEKETKTALSTLREWYTKGYIAKDFKSLKYETEMNKVVDGDYFLVAGEKWFPKLMTPKLNEKKSNAKFAPLGQIKDAAGNTNKYYSNFFIQYPAVVTKKCAHPEAVIKEMNVLYESGMRNEQDLRDMGFEFRWPLTPVLQPTNIDEVSKKGINAAKYNYDKNLTGPHFLNQGPTKSVSISHGNANSRSVSATPVSYYADTLKTLEENAYDMQATLKALPKEKQTWFDTQFISNPEAKGNPWACEAILKNNIQIQEMLDKKIAITDNGWSLAYKGVAYEDYFISLQDIERTYFTEIIMGDRPIDDFDKFIAAWRDGGGDEILAEKNEMFNKK